MATEIEAAELAHPAGLRPEDAGIAHDQGKQRWRNTMPAKCRESKHRSRTDLWRVWIHERFPGGESDSKLCTIGEGTSEIQKLVIGREILEIIEPCKTQFYTLIPVFGSTMLKIKLLSGLVLLVAIISCNSGEASGKDQFRYRRGGAV